MPQLHETLRLHRYEAVKCALARELGAGLALVAAQEWARRLLVNFDRVTNVGNMGRDLYSARHRPDRRAFRKDSSG
jgi:hypothetical protein